MSSKTSPADKVPVSKVNITTPADNNRYVAGGTALNKIAIFRCAGRNEVTSNTFSICHTYRHEFAKIDDMIATISQYRIDPALSDAECGRKETVPDFNQTDEMLFQTVVELIAYSNNARANLVTNLVQSGIFGTIFCQYDVRQAAQLDPAYILQTYWS